MLQRVNIEVIDKDGGRAATGEVGSAVPGTLTVERGLVLTPEVLQRLLPEVAIAVKGAIQGESRAIKTEQSPPPKPQLLPKIKQDQHQTREQNPLQAHKLKQAKAKQPNSEIRQRWNMFPCNLCTLRFPCRHTLNEHRVNHDPFRRIKYMCQSCPRMFTKKSGLNRHTMIHLRGSYQDRKSKCLRSMRFLCSLCEKYFSSITSLNAHRKLNMCNLQEMLLPTKNHICATCSEEFENSFDLTIHMRTHGAPLKSYCAQKPKETAIDCTKPQAKNPKLDSTNAATPDNTTTNNETMTKKVTVKEVFEEGFKPINTDALSLQPRHVAEVLSQEKPELTSDSSTSDSNKIILPFRYNCQDDVFAILNSLVKEEKLRGKRDEMKNEGENKEESNGPNAKDEVKEEREHDSQTVIDLTDEVNSISNNIEYVSTNLKKEFPKDIHCLASDGFENTAAVKAEETEAVFGSEVTEYGNDIRPSAIVKEEHQELAFDKESMIKAELLSQCKHEIKDELALGPLFRKLQADFEAQRHKDSAAHSDIEQNIETVIVKDERLEFADCISEEFQSGRDNAALEAAWRELYAEHEAMRLELGTILKDPEITDTVDLTAVIKSEENEVRVKEEFDIIESKITDVAYLTDIEKDQNAVSVKEENN